ncbi:mechanosensitive ion channel protein MscS [Malaciobacter molluscorum LMG 25693]|uniref:Mechanosensitive ion channel family protein n=1 Tax=Malaciobacter molluscorum LMG 25693 TaxID=870501 RepID=A0A2G1DLT7_9BACT|nr:mechanosensitive ion channel family protein [Malaciobacter molluscorum]AXX92246.1 mechanosensitive ion channel family protein [Malaciobacter molluscorum LMG 25693]PHO19473.1 mechanosensitive ion channel protein MscS [Malaciobacter molluscorum LMG 25693]
MQEELESIQKVYNVLIEFFMNYSFQLLGAIIILILGFFVAKKISQAVEKLCLKNNLDITLTKFIVNVVRFTIIIGAAIIAIGKLGITLTPFIAGIGAASLGAGLALQGTLSNYGAGLSIIITRPFIVGNTISVKDVYGIVEEIKLAHTILLTEDGEKITVPNKYIIGEVIVNSFDYRIVESTIGIAYNSDVESAITLILEELENYKDLISTEAKPQVGIKNFGDSSINIEYRYWAKTDSYFEIQYKINLAIFNTLKKNSIEIPFPIRDVFIHNT